MEGNLFKFGYFKIYLKKKMVKVIIISVIFRHGKIVSKINFEMY